MMENIPVKMKETWALYGLRKDLVDREKSKNIKRRGKWWGEVPKEGGVESRIR